VGCSGAYIKPAGRFRQLHGRGGLNGGDIVCGFGFGHTSSRSALQAKGLGKADYEEINVAK